MNTIENMLESLKNAINNNKESEHLKQFIQAIKDSNKFIKESEIMKQFTVSMESVIKQMGQSFPSIKHQEHINTSKLLVAEWNNMITQFNNNMLELENKNTEERAAYFRSIQEYMLRK